VPDGKPETTDSTVAVVLGLLLPGGSHLYRGRFGKAAFFGALVLGSFLAGLLLSGFHAVSPKHQPYWFLGQVFAGLPALAAALLGPADAVQGARVEAGTLYTTVAGLLNVLVVLDAAFPSPRARGEETGPRKEGVPTP
jgi:hypothetical protein